MDMRERKIVSMEELLKVWNSETDIHKSSKKLIDFLDDLYKEMNALHSMKAGITLVLPEISFLVAAFAAERVLSKFKDLSLLVPVENGDPWHLSITVQQHNT